MPIYLYRGSGASGYELEQERADLWDRLQYTASRLLNARKETVAIEILESLPFRLFEASNHFQDQFYVLSAQVAPEDYDLIEENRTEPEFAPALGALGDTLNEVGLAHVRFITVEMDTSMGHELVRKADPVHSSLAVRLSLAEAHQSVLHGRAPAAVDRLHTALHGYLRGLAASANVIHKEREEVTGLFSRLRESHPGLAELRGDSESTKILRSFATIIDSLNKQRNSSSLAHPTATLLDDPEAVLYVNSCQTFLSYLDAVLRRSSEKTQPGSPHDV